MTDVDERALHDVVLGAGEDGAMTDIGRLNATCDNCRYANLVYAATTLPAVTAYECRRFPPTVNQRPNGGGTLIDWPIVGGDTWCGEHQWHPGACEPAPEVPER